MSENEVNNSINESEEIDYKALFERERALRIQASDELTELQAKNAELQAKVDKVRNNIFYRLIRPFKMTIHKIRFELQRVKNCGSLKGVIEKIKFKRRQTKAMKSYGTAGFPDSQERKRQQNTSFDRMVKISILVPLYNTPKNFLNDMIDSVLKQTYTNWELCLADGSDDKHSFVGSICKEYADKDKRIVYKKLEKNQGISGNTNECYKMATGEFIGLFDHDDILHPSALYEYVKVINEKDADYIYCDEVTFDNKNINKMLTIHFKPDYAIDNLRANNYICHFSCFDKKLLEGTELFRTQFDGSQDHDMILRLTDKARNVVHVPKILYYWRSHKASVASGIEAKEYAIDAAKGAVADHLKRHGFRNFKITSTRAFPTIFKITYEIIGRPLVSIVIANKDHKDDLKRCIDSILERTAYDNYEIVVVENNSETREIFEYYDEIQNNRKIKVVKYEGEFNYSAINNLGVRNSNGDYVLLLNNDIQVISMQWIDEMLMYAQREDVGAVGAKLYYPNFLVQHAGVVLQLGQHRTAGHIMCLFNREAVGYMGKLCYAQNMSAVTGACLMVSRAKYDEVGGLDESFKVCLNDVDLCLKLRDKNYLNIFTPFAELFHYESQSRGLDVSPEQMKRYDDESDRFKAKWHEVLDLGDPYYNPNISLDHNDYTIRTPEQ